MTGSYSMPLLAAATRLAGPGRPVTTRGPGCASPADYSIGPVLEYAPVAGSFRTEAGLAGVRVAVLGAGNLGTTLAIVLAGGVPGIRAGRGRDVVLWTIEPDVAREIRGQHLNTKYLPGVPLPRGLSVTENLPEALAGAGIVLVTVPSK